MDLGTYPEKPSHSPLPEFGTREAFGGKLTRPTNSEFWCHACLFVRLSEHYDEQEDRISSLKIPGINALVNFAGKYFLIKPSGGGKAEYYQLFRVFFFFYSDCRP